MNKASKIALIVVGSIIVLFILSSIFANKDGKENDIAEIEAETITSIPKYTQEQIDSITNEIKSLSKNFTETTDEFKGTTWIEPKSKPKYRNQNGIYMYFQTKDSKPTNLRFVIQYYADDWLFIKKVWFLIDDKRLDYELDFDRDNGYGGKIWEWCDVQCNDPVFLAYILEAKNVRLKLEGTHYFKEKNVSAKELKSMQETIRYYMLLEMLWNIEQEKN